MLTQGALSALERRTRSKEQQIGQGWGQTTRLETREARDEAEGIKGTDVRWRCAAVSVRVCYVVSGWMVVRWLTSHHAALDHFWRVFLKKENMR